MIYTHVLNKGGRGVKKPARFFEGARGPFGRHFCGSRPLGVETWSEVVRHE